MKPAIENQISEALQWIQKTGSAVQDFAIEQAPLYCREVIALQFAKGIALILIGTIGLTAAVMFWRKYKRVSGRRAANGGYGSDGEEFAFCSVLVGLIAMAVFGFGMVTAVSAKIAPRVVLVNHLRNL